MKLNWVTTDEMAKIYTQRMTIDFPPSELKPLERIIETMETGLCKVVTMKEEDIIYAYAVLIFPENGNYILLDYFAINSDYRGKGYGHQFLTLLRQFMLDKFPMIQGMFIESEKVEPDLEDREIREKRIAFYLDCGCEQTKLESCLFGVTFSIFFFRFHGESQVGYGNLDEIYKAMFIDKHYQTQVRIWEIS